MASKEGKLLLVCIVVILVMHSFESTFAEQDWETIKARVFSVCRPAIRKGHKGSGKSFTECCEAMAKEDIDGICKHLDEADEHDIDPKKLVHVARECGHKLASTEHCGTYKIPPPPIVTSGGQQ
ncbi:uncharacterized protein [Triticum aestivum]|uniref:uncharacterized protein n=1 Tax=Triticum aestivum TaxID=4565 RepID=UPI001D033F61|nr:uncharacterized protein LOC123099123 [Triticum aestivum]